MFVMFYLIFNNILAPYEIFDCVYEQTNLLQSNWSINSLISLPLIVSDVEEGGVYSILCACILMLYNHN